MNHFFSVLGRGTWRFLVELGLPTPWVHLAEDMVSDHMCYTLHAQKKKKKTKKKNHIEPHYRHELALNISFWSETGTEHWTIVFLFWATTVNDIVSQPHWESVLGKFPNFRPTSLLEAHYRQNFPCIINSQSESHINWDINFIIICMSTIFFVRCNIYVNYLMRES